MSGDEFFAQLLGMSAAEFAALKIIITSVSIFFLLVVVLPVLVIRKNLHERKQIKQVF